MISIFKQFDQDRLPKHKIELHVHLDGSYRPSTVWELAQKKGIDLGVPSFKKFLDALKIKQPTTLEGFLKKFQMFSPVIAGDLDSIERIAYEFCEDQSSQGVAYFEARYSPHLFCKGNKAITPEMVVERVNKSFHKGEQDFNIKARSILCCIRGFPEWSEEVLNLCEQFKCDGVVGIDIAGDEKSCLGNPCDPEIFRKAKELGIHRTLHAGEAGPAENVQAALVEFHAERIGHGYHAVDNEKIYKQCLFHSIHFEVCPYSSLETGAVSRSIAKHPIVRFAEDGANFSINRDDPIITGTLLDDEYALLSSLGLTDLHFARANFNAANSCFLPPHEKEALLEYMRQVYNIYDFTSNN